MSAELWFDGVYLLGRFNPHRTGCWLLSNGGEAAILEMPPGGPGERPPAEVAAVGVAVQFLLCSNAHLADFNRTTLQKMRAAFPDAAVCLHTAFRQQVGDSPGVRYFDDVERLELAGEALFLVHAPKFSAADVV